MTFSKRITARRCRDPLPTFPACRGRVAAVPWAPCPPTPPACRAHAAGRRRAAGGRARRRAGLVHRVRGRRGRTPGPDVGTPLASVAERPCGHPRAVVATAPGRGRGAGPRRSAGDDLGLARARTGPAVTPDVRDVAHEFPAPSWVRTATHRPARRASLRRSPAPRPVGWSGSPVPPRAAGGSGRSGVRPAVGGDPLPGRGSLRQPGDRREHRPRRTPGCSATPGRAAPSRSRARVSRRGLAQPALLDRAGRWCVAVANSADPS